jgi:hypothetical protein
MLKSSIRNGFDFWISFPKEQWIEGDKLSEREEKNDEKRKVNRKKLVENFLEKVGTKRKEIEEKKWKNN